MSELNYYVNTDIASLSATRIINEEDLGFPTTQLPKGLRTALHLEVVSKELVNYFTNVRRNVENYLFEVSVRTSNSRILGYAIDPDSRLDVDEKLREYKAEYDEAMAKAKAQYPSLCQELLKNLRDKYEDFEYIDQLADAVERSMPLWAKIEDGLEFKHCIFQAQAPEHHDAMAQLRLASGYDAITQGLYGQLLADVAKKANKVRVSLKKREDKEKVSQKTVNQIRGLLVKVRNMSFVDKRVKSLADAFKSALSNLPDTNSLEGYNVEYFTNLVKALCDQLALQEAIEQGQDILPQYVKPQVSAVTSAQPASSVSQAQAPAPSVTETPATHQETATEDSQESEAVVESTQEAEKVATIELPLFQQEEEAITVAAQPASSKASAPKHVDRYNL